MQVTKGSPLLTYIPLAGVVLHVQPARHLGNGCSEADKHRCRKAALRKVAAELFHLIARYGLKSALYRLMELDWELLSSFGLCHCTSRAYLDADEAATSFDAKRQAPVQRVRYGCRVQHQ